MEIIEIIGFLVFWGITVPICFLSSKKIKSNRVVAVLAGLFIPILSSIVYSYLASNYKNNNKTL